MDCHKAPIIDYQAAADRCLVVLFERAESHPSEPIAAPALCERIFPPDLWEKWDHESRRRRVREAVVEARKLLVARGQASEENKIVSSCNPATPGYWITADRRVIAWYADQRRRSGLQQLAAAGDAQRTLAHAGQQSLFGDVDPPPPSALRH